MEDNIEIEINALGVKKTKEIVDEYNKSLSDLKGTLQDEYGTCNINQAISIAIASTAISIGIEIAEALLTFGASELAKLGDEIADIDTYIPTGISLSGPILEGPIGEPDIWVKIPILEPEPEVFVSFPEILKAPKLINPT